MAHVRFKSNVPRHTRELTAADFKSLGVEEDGLKKTVFNAGEPTEVSDAVAAALVEKLPGEFETVEADAETTTVTEQASDKSDEGNTDTATGGGSRDGAGARTARTR